MFLAKGARFLSVHDLTYRRSKQKSLCLDYIDELVRPFIRVPGVTAPSWSRFIFKSAPCKEKLGAGAAAICSTVDPAAALASEVVFMDDDNCYFNISVCYRYSYCLHSTVC